MAINQLGDGSPDGWQLPNTKGGLFGAPPVAQPAGAAQKAVARGQAAGVITTYSTSQSPSAVTANTTAEKSMTVQTGSGFAMQPATTDLFYINKPTAQAGLGYGNVRVSSANTLGVTFSNFTSGSITPTTTESYTAVGIRGLPTLSATLSPAAVAANSTAEQQFTVAGLAAGQLVAVSKPTAQAGIDIVGVRAVANNILGITFTNVTASPVTPTAAESYTIIVLSGLDAVNNHVNYGFNVGTVGAIGVGVVVTGGSTTLTGMLATDSIIGVQKPTNGAAATNAAFVIGGVPTANVLTLYYGGIGTGATPTANEVYTISTIRLNPVAPLVLYTPSLAPTSVAANTTAEQTFTVTGLISGTPVWINKSSSAQNGLGIAGVRVSATNTLAITYCNSTASAIVPATEVYTVGNFQVPAPGNGNSVFQAVAAAGSAGPALVNALQNALASTGLIAGS